MEDNYTPLTEEEIEAVAQRTSERRDKLLNNLLDVKKAQLAKLVNLKKEEDRIEANRKSRAKLKRKAAKESRRKNRRK